MTGIVHSVDEQTARVRVQFPNLDNLVSAWLPVLQEFCVGNQGYRLPDVASQVVCLMDANYEAGVVLGAIYSDSDPPPVTDANLYYRRFLDGTVLQYDRAGHKLLADVQGEIEVKATGDCNAEIQGKTVLKSMGTIELDGGSGAVKGLVQGDCLCAYTASPHPHISATVKGSK